MKSFRKIILVLSIALSQTGWIFSQDPEFSQFYSNRLYLNPAYAGEKGCYRMMLSYRNQWPSLGSTYVTYSFSADKFVEKLKGGVGLHIMRDNEGGGAFNTTSISGMYSLTFKLDHKFYLKTGFQVSYIQKKINRDFVFPDMIDPLYGIIYPTNEPDFHHYAGYSKTGFADFSAGAIVIRNDYFMGFSVHHLTEHEESFYENSEAVLPRKYSLHMGNNIPLRGRHLKKGEMYITPNVLFQQQANFQQLNFGFYTTRKSVVAGIMLRQNFRFDGAFTVALLFSVFEDIF